MRVRVEPLRAEIGSAGAAVFTVEVYNTDDVIRAYTVDVLGIDRSWYRVTGDDLSLFPETAGYATIIVDPPRDLPAGPQRLAVQISESSGADGPELVELTVERAAERRVTVELHPPLVTGGRRASVAAVVANTGNAPVTVTPKAADMEDLVTALFDPPSFVLDVRQQQIVDVRVTGPRPLLGSPEPRTVTVSVDGPDLPAEATATFVQRPWIGRGIVALAGLLTAATVFTLVLAANLDRVVAKASVDDELLIKAIEDREEVASIAAVPASISGTVTEAASGDPVAGVTVELYAADDPIEVIRTAATGDDGTFDIGALPGGSYKIRLVGAGFSEIWYEAAATFDGATEVEVEPGATVDGVAVTVGGQPGSVAGLLLADDPVGAVATLYLPGSVTGSDTDAVAATVFVASDGTFVFEDVPAPATYRLEVIKPGHAKEVRSVRIGAGETVTGIEILLRDGDGQITGTVFGPDGPVGGVTVTATDGAATVITTSLTSGQIGTFTVRDLVTPASYTVTASGPGFRDEVVTVVLDEGQQLDGVAITLARDTGSLSGVARLAGAGPIGGVTVTVTNGEVSLFTTTLSAGAVGSWSVSGLPSPGTYTVTFARPDLVAQTRSVDLDPLAGNDVGGIDASLTPRGAVVAGTVSDENGAVGGVDVTVSDGRTTFRSRSADSPLGAYEIRDIAPGTYTVTFSRPGSTPQTVLVSLAAGEVRTLDVQVATRASISGTIRRTSTGNPPVAGAQVLLYRFDEFPLNPLRTVITGPAGTYAFPDLTAPENYVIEVAPVADAPGVDSRALSLSASQQATGIDFTID